MLIILENQKKSLVTGWLELNGESVDVEERAVAVAVARVDLFSLDLSVVGVWALRHKFLMLVKRPLPELCLVDFAAWSRINDLPATHPICLFCHLLRRFSINCNSVDERQRLGLDREKISKRIVLTGRHVICEYSSGCSQKKC
ncbi:hypothetical protein D917_04563 [Trichinella nativa]|uniref:Uncharacterized protein n=2 Tax=Trichinella TaxID=6333 RepID=A0A1Y3E472_9BILA|nr:hypothetical protein T01_13683 [Trichinella spiralis]OUC39845.1 hypothetical protein D917_04563 [Trichinella nativa]